MFGFKASNAVVPNGIANLKSELINKLVNRANAVRIYDEAEYQRLTGYANTLQYNNVVTMDTLTVMAQLSGIDFRIQVESVQRLSRV